MAKHLQRELEKIKKSILSLGALVEDRVRLAIKSIESRNAEIAEQIVSMDYEIDEMEVDIEEECLKALALYQPVAVDLRYVVGVLKINHDLERISDLAQHIAERAIQILQSPALPLALDVSPLAAKVRIMLRNSIDAFVGLDVERAREVCQADDEVDACHKQFTVSLKAAIREHPDTVETLLSYLSISRHLERIADHATNIAEDLVYMIEGDIVRHKKVVEPKS